jgi:hypothetical protein
MMTVRFPSGVSIQYNDAHYVQRTDTYSDLYTKKDGFWIAQVPTKGCVIEVQRACRVYDACAGDRAEQVLQNLEGLPHNTLRQLKRRLAKYRSRSAEWRQ